MNLLSSTQGLLFTLLLKVGVAASMAALLARWAVFRRVLYTEVRDSDQKVKLLLFLTPVLGISVLLRLVGSPFEFADLMAEGSFLLGLLGGLVVGPLGGSIVSLPAFFHHEWLATPFAALAGLMGGAAASRLRRAGSGTTAARPRYTAPPLALLYRCAQLVVRAAADAGDPNGRGCAHQNLEQHQD
jgi:hypothetical protein